MGVSFENIASFLKWSLSTASKRQKKKKKKIPKESQSCQKLITLFNSKTTFVWEALTRIKKNNPV